MGNPNTGKKKGAYSTDIDLISTKEYCKRTGITVNYHYLSVLSKTLYDYMSLKSQGHKLSGNSSLQTVPKHIKMGIPINFRPNLT